MRRVEVDGRPIPPQPSFGCYWAAAFAGVLPRTDPPHVLSWAGWWQSGNPDVVLPRWLCSCGRRTYGEPQAAPPIMTGRPRPEG